MKADFKIVAKSYARIANAYMKQVRDRVRSVGVVRVRVRVVGNA